MVYFVLALWLFRGRNCGYGQVMTKLADGLYGQAAGAGDLLAGQQLDPAGWLGRCRGRAAVAAAEHLLAVAGPRQARPGTGPVPVRPSRPGPVGEDGAPGVSCCGLRVVSIDGSTSDVPDSAANDEHFGRPSNQARDGAFPQVRWLAAAESGTGSLLGHPLGPYRDSEQALARDLLEQGCFGPGMLVLADRKFLSWALAREFLATRARIPVGAHGGLHPQAGESPGRRHLSGGTDAAAQEDGPPLLVRVIEYTVHTAPEDGGDEENSELFCLVTNLLDPGEYPALDLAPSAATRAGGDDETVIGHHKTDMGHGQPVLRSKDPGRRRAGNVGPVRRLPGDLQDHRDGAAAAGIPPDTISFPHALAAATDTVAAS